MIATCTVQNAVTGKCGKPAIYTWVSTITGETFAECAEHFQGVQHATPRDGHRVGDTVAVQRHGKTYNGRVVRITRNGNVYAEVTYNNGATRTVRV